MKVLMADELGFCFGVKRAIEMVENASRERGGIETIGAVVHNHRVVESLREMNVEVVNGLEQARGRLVAVTAHGAAPGLFAEAQERGLEVFDTTCPFVKKAQRAARGLAEAEFDVYVYGDPEHPEVRGILGWAGGRAIAGKDCRQVMEAMQPGRRVGLLSQTTQATEHFANFVKGMISHGLENFTEFRVVNTICSATIGRQSAVKKLAREVELMLVVGSRSSANTKHLAELAMNTGIETYLVESAGEVEMAWLRGRESVGISAGASTPDTLIAEVVKKLNSLSK